MKKIVIAVLAAIVVQQANAAERTWLTDFSKAQAQAKAENKFVVMDFTGSDWCPGCIMLGKNVFDTPEFQAYAANHLVLVKVDFPHGKSQPAELKQANEALSDRFKVDALPTVIVLDKDGKQLGQQEGYRGESPKEFIAELEKIEKGSR
ncbi:MAG TPA: thioredoxin family protein [Verrucomicrobiae bacterium]